MALLFPLAQYLSFDTRSFVSPRRVNRYITRQINSTRDAYVRMKTAQLEFCAHTTGA